MKSDSFDAARHDSAAKVAQQRLHEGSCVISCSAWRRRSVAAAGNRCARVSVVPPTSMHSRTAWPVAAARPAASRAPDCTSEALDERSSHSPSRRATNLDCSAGSRTSAVIAPSASDSASTVSNQKSDSAAGTAGAAPGSVLAPTRLQAGARLGPGADAGSRVKRRREEPARLERPTAARRTRPRRPRSAVVVRIVR